MTQSEIEEALRIITELLAHASYNVDDCQCNFLVIQKKYHRLKEIVKDDK